MRNKSIFNSNCNAKVEVNIFLTLESHDSFQWELSIFMKQRIHEIHFMNNTPILY